MEMTEKAGYGKRAVFDEEVLSLVAPLSMEKEKKLRDGIMRGEFIEKIYAYHGTIISGFDTYAICIERNITPVIEEQNFRNRLSVLTYVCLSQLSREDIGETFRKYLIGKWYLFETEKMKIRKKRGDKSGQGSDLHYITSISEYIGRCIWGSAGVVKKYAFFARATDELRKKAFSLTNMILQDKVRISHENMIRLSGMNKEVISMIHLRIMKTGDNHIVYADLVAGERMRKETSVCRRNTGMELGSRKREIAQPLIRQMPKFDPDAALKSLTLTIPSWSANMARALERTDFSLTSEKAETDLMEKLQEMEQSMEEIKKRIKETNREWKDWKNMSQM